MGRRAASRLRGRGRSSSLVEWERRWREVFGEDDIDQLLTAAGRGDLAAFAEFYDITAPLVFGSLCGLCGLCGRDGGVEAEQLMEQIYLQVWRQAPRFHARDHSAVAVLLAHVRGQATRAVLTRSVP